MWQVVSGIGVLSSDRDLQVAAVAMNDDIYHKAVGEFAPHFAQPAG